MTNKRFYVPSSKQHTSLGDRWVVMDRSRNDYVGHFTQRSAAREYAGVLNERYEYDARVNTDSKRTATDAHQYC